MDSCKWGVVEWERPGLWEGGRWRVSLGPINSSLTGHLRVISHALLASRAGHHPRGSTVCPYGQTGNSQDEGRV